MIRTVAWNAEPRRPQRTDQNFSACSANSAFELCRFLTEIDTPSRSGTMAVMSSGCAARRSLYSAIARVSSAVVSGVLRIARHDLAVPQHVVGDQQPARPQQADQPIEQRLVQLLVAVLEDQIERSRHLRDLQLRVADDDADAIGEAGAGEIRRALLPPAPRSAPSSAACRPAAARRRARCRNSRSPCRSRGCASAPTAVASTRSSAPTSASTSGRPRVVVAARDLIEHGIAGAS